MKLTELMDKHQQVQLAIFQTIIESEQAVSMKTLEKRTKVSLPTLQKEIRSLSFELNNFDQNSSLVKTDNDSLTLKLSNTFRIKEFIYSYLVQAQDYQILYFIFKHKKVSITKMTIELQMSEASIFRRLKTINHLLSEYNIQFKNKQLVGPEMQIRIFFYHFFEHSLPLEKMKLTFKNPTFRNLILVIEKQFNQQFSNKKYWQLALWFGIMQSRLDYQARESSICNPDMLNLIEQDDLYQILKNILARYLSRFAIQWSEEEAIFLYLFFMSEGLLDLKENRNSHFVTNFLAINHKIHQLITDKKVEGNEFDTFLLPLHFKIVFYQGWITINEIKGPFLSDLDADKMSQCMSVVEKKLSKEITHSQWQMLDQAYGFMFEIFKRRQQKELIIGIAFEDSLESEENFYFIQSHLIGLSHIVVKKAKERVYDLLITNEFADLQKFNYQELFLYNGTRSTFEINRLKRTIQELLEKG